jgi:2-dehydro-3-deoxyphosphooctonate aldolase (KDO 8-P synthase)
MIKKIPLENYFVGPGEKLLVICGPCVIENEEHTLFAAEALSKIFAGRGVNFVFKSSYDKANRSSSKSFRGPGLEEGLKILQRVKSEFGVPVITDVHSPEEALIVGETLGCLQIPAFLCRQTDLILAAAKSGAFVNVKKGQFMAPLDMKNVVDKIKSEGNDKILLVERGATFGYNNLVCDMRSIPMMQSLGVPVCFDATHAVQLPGGRGDSSGGERQYIPVLAKAAISAGANALFIEAHDNPEQAKSDSASVLDFKSLPKLLDTVERLYAIAQEG